MKTISLLPVLLVIALLSACGNPKPVRHARRATATATERVTPAATEPEIAAATPSATLPSQPRTVAHPIATGTVVIVNGRSITRARFQQALEAASGASVLDQLVTEMLVDEELARRHLSVPTSQINTRLRRETNRIRSRGPQASAFLQTSGSMERLRIQVTDMLKLGRLLFGEADLRRFYTQHQKDLFKGRSYDKARDDVWQALFTEKYRQGDPQKLLIGLKRRAKLQFTDPRYAFMTREYREASYARPPAPVRPMTPRIRPVTPPPPSGTPVPVPPPGGAPTPTPPSAPPVPPIPPAPPSGNP